MLRKEKFQPAAKSFVIGSFFRTNEQGNPNPVISFGERESAVYYDCPPAAHPTASAQFLNVPKKDPSTS